MNPLFFCSILSLAALGSSFEIGDLQYSVLEEEEIYQLAEWYAFAGKITSAATVSTVIIGLFGNMCCLVLFSSPKIRQLSSVHYLIGLAVADCGFLLMLFFTWLRSVTSWNQVFSFCIG